MFPFNRFFKFDIVTILLITLLYIGESRNIEYVSIPFMLGLSITALYNFRKSNNSLLYISFIFWSCWSILYYYYYPYQAALSTLCGIVIGSCYTLIYK